MTRRGRATWSPTGAKNAWIVGTSSSMPRISNPKSRRGNWAEPRSIAAPTHCIDVTWRQHACSDNAQRSAYFHERGGAPLKISLAVRGGDHHPDPSCTFCHRREPNGLRKHGLLVEETP